MGGAAEDGRRELVTGGEPKELVVREAHEIWPKEDP
jgi:hypothetical protein